MHTPRRFWCWVFLCPALGDHHDLVCRYLTSHSRIRSQKKAKLCPVSLSPFFSVPPKSPKPHTRVQLPGMSASPLRSSESSTALVFPFLDHRLVPKLHVLLSLRFRFSWTYSSSLPIPLSVPVAVVMPPPLPLLPLPLPFALALKVSFSLVDPCTLLFPVAIGVPTLDTFAVED